MYAQARPGLIPVPSFAGLPRRPVVQEIRSVACWAKKKGTRIIVTLECTEARAEGKPPSRYTTQKVQCKMAIGMEECCVLEFISALLTSLYSEVVSLHLSCPRAEQAQHT